MRENILRILSNKRLWVDSECACISWDFRKNQWLVSHHDIMDTCEITDYHFDILEDAIDKFLSLVEEEKITKTEEEIDELFFS